MVLPTQKLKMDKPVQPDEQITETETKIKN